MRPTVSRDVHYVAPGSADGTYPPAHRAAKITEIPLSPIDGKPLDDERVNLFVMNPQGTHFPTFVPHDEETKGPYTWHWPEREE